MIAFIFAVVMGASLHNGIEVCLGCGAYSVGGPSYGLLGAKVLASIVVLTAFLVIGTEFICRIGAKRKWQPPQVFLVLLGWIAFAAVVILAGATWAIV